MTKLDAGTTPTLLGPKEAEAILRLRLIVARAAQIDSLRWWDDRSLTLEGDFMTARLFPEHPRVAGAKIAMATARARHWAAIPRPPGVVHLFDLGDELERELAAAPLNEAWIPGDSFAAMDAFVFALGNIAPDGAGCRYSGQADTQTGALRIELSLDTSSELKSALAEAGALALAYNSAGMARPVFPYLQR